MLSIILTVAALFVPSQNFGVYGYGYPDIQCLEKHIPKGEADYCYAKQPIKPQKLSESVAIPFIIHCSKFNGDMSEGTDWCACMAAVAPYYKFTAGDLYKLIQNKDQTELERSASAVCLKLDKQFQRRQR